MTRKPEPLENQSSVTSVEAVRRIGPYRLMRRLAEGGMSSVYQAYDENAQQTVAVKVLADALSGKPEFVRRFRREARLSQMLRDDHLVRGLSSGYDSEAGKHYLSMEYVAGPTAAALLNDHRQLPISLVVRIAIDIASALSYLHGIHFVHRDVKPENILIDPSGYAKLADLGLSRRIDTSSDLTASNQGIGTPHYMPHEQAQNSSLVDGRSDLFSLGATLYHLATGNLPFPGDTHEAIAIGKESGLFHPLHKVIHDVPADVDRIMTKLLERDLRYRYQNARDVVADLTATGLAATPSQLSAYVENGTLLEVPRNPDELMATRTDLEVKPPSPSSSQRILPRLAVIGLLSLLCGAGMVFSEGQIADGETDANPADYPTKEILAVPAPLDDPSQPPQELKVKRPFPSKS